MGETTFVKTSDAWAFEAMRLGAPTIPRPFAIGQSRAVRGNVQPPNYVPFFNRVSGMAVSCLGLGEGGCDCTALAMH